MKLSALEVGESGKVVGFSTTDPQYRQKLLRMGLSRNASLKVVRKALFGRLIAIEVKGSHLALRSGEADGLEIKRG